MPDKEAEATMEDGTWIKRWRLDLRGACFTAIFCVAEASGCVGVCVCASLVVDTTWRGCIGFTPNIN